MSETDQAVLAYVARRDVSPQWRGFLRALVETLDASLDAQSRDALLRAVGARLADSLPLPGMETLAALQDRMNDALAAMAWGYVAVSLDEGDRSLRLTHFAAPAIALPGHAGGAWFGPVLEGLYGAWLAAQQGGGGASEARLHVVEAVPGRIELRYGQ